MLIQPWLAAPEIAHVFCQTVVVNCLSYYMSSPHCLPYKGNYLHVTVAVTMIQSQRHLEPTAACRCSMDFVFFVVVQLNIS